MQPLTEKIFAFVFLLVGVSHVLHPQPWVDLFAWLRSKSFGAFIVVIYTLPIAVIIITFHNNWRLAPSLFLTVAGWLMLVKSVVYFLYPAAFHRAARAVASLGKMTLAGTIAIVFSIAMLADIYIEN